MLEIFACIEIGCIGNPKPVLPRNLEFGLLDYICALFVPKTKNQTV